MYMNRNHYDKSLILLCVDRLSLSLVRYGHRSTSCYPNNIMRRTTGFVLDWHQDFGFIHIFRLIQYPNRVFRQ